MSRTPTGPSQKQKQPNPQLFSPFWWVVFLLLAIWNVWTLVPQSRHEIFIPKHLVIDATIPFSRFLIDLLGNVLPFLLFIGLMAWMGCQSLKSRGILFNFGNSKASQHNEERPQVTFKDVAGAEETKEKLSEVVKYLRNPQKYHAIGARIPRGILLVGHSGTGKTLLARAVAGEAEVPFFSISASEFVEMFMGVGARRVHSLFEQAKAIAPAIIFIDELDAVGRLGMGPGAVIDEREQTLNQLLVEMYGFDDRHGVVILAATNRPDVLDPALLRPGRFDREITVDLPDRQAREDILKIHSHSLKLVSNVNLEMLARSTTGFSGADLANLCNEAALISTSVGHELVSIDDFEEALDRIIVGAAHSTILNDHDRRLVAYHEAGHAMAAWLLPQADPVYKVTIIPHGHVLGVTGQPPTEYQTNYSRSYLLARITVLLGGRTAEEIAIGDITTAAENDLVEATRLARRMITRWGMGDLGLMALASNEDQPFLGNELSQARNYSEETSARIDRAIQQLLDEQHEIVKNLLAGSREKLDRLVDTLLREETLNQDELTRILGTRNLELADMLAIASE